VLNNIGAVYAALGEKQQALRYYEQALPLSRQVGNRPGEATTLSNIGGVYAALGEKQQALAYYEQAVSLFRHVGDRWHESTVRYNMAMAYQSLDRLDEAEAQLIEVVALDEAIGHPNLESNRAALEKIRAAQRGPGIKFVAGPRRPLHH
jgi:tetratricopeptide (TPR) repeat protein